MAEMVYDFCNGDILHRLIKEMLVDQDKEVDGSSNPTVPSSSIAYL